MYIPLLFLVPALICIAVLALALGFHRYKVIVLRDKLKVAMHNRAEIGNFLNLFSQNIKTTDEISNWMNVTARYVADLVEAQSVCVFTLENDSLVASGVAGAFPPLHKADAYVMTKPRYILESLRKEHIHVGEGIVGEVALTGADVVIDNPQDPRIADIDPVSLIDALMAVPMLSEGRVVGVICAVNSKAKDMRPFSSEQLARLKFIAGQAVLAQNIMLVYSHLSEQQRINQELEFARNLQSSLLPKRFPVWGRFMIHAFTRASKEVSGDFYDFVEIDRDRLLVVIGDACGKGIPACMIMAMTRSFIRANSSHFVSMKDFLQNLNDNLYRDTGDGRYITLGICLLDKRESTIEYARAGHTELLVYIRNHIRSINPDGAGLGLLPSDLADCDTICLEFSPDMAVLLFTDGINEAVNPEGEYFGIERIRDVYMKSCIGNDTPEESVSKIMDAVDSFSGNPESQADDQTLVIIRHI